MSDQDLWGTHGVESLGAIRCLGRQVSHPEILESFQTTKSDSVKSDVQLPHGSRRDRARKAGVSGAGWGPHSPAPQGAAAGPMPF